MNSPETSDATGAGTPMASDPNCPQQDEQENTIMTDQPVNPAFMLPAEYAEWEAGQAQEKADAEWSAVPVDSDGITMGSIPDRDLDRLITSTIPPAPTVDIDGQTYQVVDTRSTTPGPDAAVSSTHPTNGEIVHGDAHRLHDVLLGVFARILGHCDTLQDAAQLDLAAAADWNRHATTGDPQAAARRDDYCARAAELIDWSAVLSGIVIEGLAAADLDSSGGAR